MEIKYLKNYMPSLDSDTIRAVDTFVQRLTGKYEWVEIILFGSRARQQHFQTSDADVAILLRGRLGCRLDTALAMADIAFDVMLETGVLVEAIPFWEDEWEHPETFSNPALIANIRRQGVHFDRH